MMPPQWSDDPALLADLRAALRGSGEVPPECGSAASASAFMDAASASEVLDAASASEVLDPASASEFVDAARASLRWRDSGGGPPIAELVFDSACDPEPAGLTRSGGVVRTLAFHGGEVEVEIEVGPDGLAGQLWPGAGGQVTAQAASGAEQEAAVDPAGFFTLAAPPEGPVRLHARTDAHAVVTDWVCLL